MVCERSSIFGSFRRRQEMPAVVPDSSQLRMGQKEQPIFAIAPNLVLVQLLGQFSRSSPSVLEIKKCHNS